MPVMVCFLFIPDRPNWECIRYGYVMLYMYNIPAWPYLEGMMDVCGPGEFQCSNGACISVGLLCDGTADCPAQEDELLCVVEPSPSCRLDEVRLDVHLFVATFAPKS